MVPSHLSLLVQICPSYQLDSEGQARPVSGLRGLPQPLVCVLAGHPGSFGSGPWDPSPWAPTVHHTPSDRPGKCSTPRARLPQGCSSAWPGHPQAEREPGSGRCTQRPPGASRAGPGRAAGGRDHGQALGCLARAGGQATAGVTWTTRCRRLREAWRCWFCSALRQETWRSWGSSRGGENGSGD